MPISASSARYLRRKPEGRPEQAQSGIWGKADFLGQECRGICHLSAENLDPRANGDIGAALSPPGYFAAAYNPIQALLPVAGQLFLLLCLFVISPLILIAMLDLLYQRYNHEKELKMSKDEVKREYKDSEGNPEIKGKRKEFHRELQANTMPKQLKKTSVVVANPTHLVVGLWYDDEDCKIPAVSLKYRGVQAKKLRKLAEQQGIPVLENIPLARTLHAEAELYESIPSHLFEPVAEVIRWMKSLEA